jgi:hypothetical protein
MRYSDYADKETAYKHGHWHGYEAAMQEVKSEVSEVALHVFSTLAREDKNETYTADAEEAFRAARAFVEVREKIIAKLKEEHPVHWKDGHKISEESVLVPEKE